MSRMGPFGSLIQFGGALKWSLGCQGVAAAAADCCDSEGAEKINVNASAIAVTKQAGKKPRPCMGISVAMDE